MLLWLLLSLLPLARLLEIRFEHRKLAKVWKPKFVEKLISSSSYSSLVTILNNPKYPYKGAYLEWCTTLDFDTFNAILDNFQDNQESLRQVLTVECLDSSYVSRPLYNPRIAVTDIQPFESESLDPHELSDLFGLYVQKVLHESDRKRLDLSSFCSSTNLSTSHFEVDGIWKIFGVKCLSGLLNSEIRDKSSILNSFFNVFKLQNQDSSKIRFLKLVKLLAFKPRLRRSFFREKLMSVLNSYESFLSTQIETSDQWHRLSQMLLVSLNVTAFSCPVKKPAFLALIRMIHKALADDPEADVPWLLSLAVVLKRYPEVMLTSQSTYLILNWFFSKNPSADEVCQVFDLFNDLNYQSLFLKHLQKDEELFELVLDKCPKVAKESTLPLRMKLNRVLREKRNLGCSGSFHDANFIHSGRFGDINSVLLSSWDLLMSNYNLLACTRHGHCYEGPEFFALWYNALFLADIYHHVIAVAEDGKPVIIPSLLMPMRLALIFGQVLVRSIIYRSPLPFHLSRAYLEDPKLIENYHRCLSSDRDSGIYGAFSVSFNCSNERLQLYLKSASEYVELKEPIELKLMKRISNLQRISFLDGIRKGFGGSLAFSEIKKILQNKLL